jgi:hypothetical protein
LLFLLLDIFSHAGEEVEHVLAAAVDGDGSWARLALVGIVYVVGFDLGLVSLVYVARIGRNRKSASIGPGAMGGFVIAFVTEPVLEMAGA